MPKKDFCDFIKYVNLHKIPLDQQSLISLKNLIESWKKNVENNSLIYLENLSDYENVTDWVKKSAIAEMSLLWFNHVVKLTMPKSCGLNENLNKNLNEKSKNEIELALAHYMFKMKFSEKCDNLSNHEKEILNFYRKVAVSAILTGVSSYVDKPLIDKLLLNCRVSPYSGIKCENLEVRPSAIHGNGVFATANIQAGTIITFYPVDGYNENNSTDFKVADDWIRVEGALMENHSCTINDNLKIVADPSKTTNKMLLGHMINDSIGNTFNGITTTDLENGIYEYYMKNNSNCKLKINEKYGLIYVVTTQNIRKDTELTFQYSPLFWFSRHNTNLKHFYDVCNDGKIADFIQLHCQH